MVRTLAAAVAALCLLAAPARAGEAPLTVVELFTSQGCSSCPRADALLVDLAQRPGILALSFHVNYWDYIGWRDPFALAGNTDRQRAYSRAFGRSYVYTPQMVIDGAAETTGRGADEAESLIAAAQRAERVAMALTHADGGGMTVSVGDAKAGDPADVWLVFFDREHQTEITRGENSGRVLRHANVVRAVERLASWSGQRLTIPLAPGAMPGEACAVLLQSRATGRILGAARLADPPER